ncbi:DNA-binding transcriptional LysR family regulator [Paraburkholderia terricola]|uniref:LysR substrate-binding domain-containing protein n=1 Tax=Paraburkholderia terricola TaxID=169427 RepID=UPI00285609D5|nr:LysR substrate-binding domain-containing protein [Paraburkholderia terricola]MDR6450442.1 DNA-binding transcriptional LysR family regulator [Paraburkholderia terricola]
MARNLDIALLRAFSTIADHGSMTAAGHALHLTQGAVSQQIARLEVLCGPLFFRDHRELRLTSAGERLLGHARQLLALHDALWTEMTTGAMEGTVRLGAPQDLIGTLLGPILKGYAKVHPQVELTLVCAASPDLMRTLKRGEIDIALVEELPGASRGECLAIDRLVWVGARGGVAHRKSPLPISMVSETCAFRTTVLDELRKRELLWRTVFENGSVDATAATVRSDLAITAWLASTVPPELDILPPESGLPELPGFAINLHLSPSQNSPAVTELARHVRDGLTRFRRPVSFAETGFGM